MFTHLKSGQLVHKRYRIENVLGEGGMGVVYSAFDSNLNREVALKLLRAEAFDHDSLQRFQREAITLARIEHRHIVSIYASGSLDSRTHYLAMELVHGVSLRSVLNEEKSIPWQRAITLGRQICSALSYVHSLGVIHRDIKPNNILIVDRASPGETVKLLDFGLCTAGEGIQKLTHTGQLMGSVNYMSPEQIRGAKLVDARSDIYSLGCVLYEMLTGTPPLVADNPIGTMFMHAKVQPLAPSEANPSVQIPEALERVVMKMMEKTPALRYQTMEEVLQALIEINPLSIEKSGGRRASKLRKIPFSWRRGPSLASVGLAAAGMFFLLWSDPGPLAFLSRPPSNKSEFSQQIAIASQLQQFWHPRAAIVLLQQVVTHPDLCTAGNTIRLQALTQQAEANLQAGMKQQAAEDAITVSTEAQALLNTNPATAKGNPSFNLIPRCLAVLEQCNLSRSQSETEILNFESLAIKLGDREEGSYARAIAIQEGVVRWSKKLFGVLSGSYHERLDYHRRAVQLAFFWARAGVKTAEAKALLQEAIRVSETQGRPATLTIDIEAVILLDDLSLLEALDTRNTRLLQTFTGEDHFATDPSTDRKLIVLSQLQRLRFAEVTHCLKHKLKRQAIEKMAALNAVTELLSKSYRDRRQSIDRTRRALQQHGLMSLWTEIANNGVPLEKTSDNLQILDGYKTLLLKAPVEDMPELLPCALATVWALLESADPSVARPLLDYCRSIKFPPGTVSETQCRMEVLNGHYYRDKKDYAAAERHYRNAVSLALRTGNPTLILEYEHYLGRLLIAQQRYAAALDSLGRVKNALVAIRSGSSFGPEVEFRFANYYEGCGDYASAEKHLRDGLAMARQTKSVQQTMQWELNLGNFLARIGRNAEAEGAFRAMVQASFDPGNTAAHRLQLQGFKLLIARPNLPAAPAAAKQLYEHAMKLCTSKDLDVKIEFLLALAGTLDRNQEHAEAVEKYRQSISMASDNRLHEPMLRGYVSLARCFRSWNKPLDAEQTYHQAIKYQNETWSNQYRGWFARTHFFLQEFLASKCRFLEAQHVCEDGLRVCGAEITGEKIDLLLQLAYCFESQGNYQAAKRVLQQAVNQAPTPVYECKAHCYFGDFFLRQSQFALAATEHRKAIAISNVPQTTASKFQRQLLNAYRGLAVCMLAQNHDKEAAAYIKAAQSLRSTIHKYIVDSEVCSEREVMAYTLASLLAYSDKPDATTTFKLLSPLSRFKGSQARLNGAHLYLGMAHESQGDYQKAAEYYRKCGENGARNWKGNFGLASCHLALGNYEEMADFLKQAKTSLQTDGLNPSCNLWFDRLEALKLFRQGHHQRCYEILNESYKANIQKVSRTDSAIVQLASKAQSAAQAGDLVKACKGMQQALDSLHARFFPNERFLRSQIYHLEMAYTK